LRLVYNIVSSSQPMEQHTILEENNFKYIESGGSGTPLVLLHGLLGALSNFEGIINKFQDQHNVVVPLLPLFDIPIRTVSVMKLVEYVEEFVQYKGYTSVYFLGNSLGGHIAQLLALRNPDLVKGLILTGSSGLFESAMGTTYPKRGDMEYMRKKTESVFFDPAIATEELVQDVYATVNDLRKAMSVVAVAKSAVRHNLEDKLCEIKCPTLLVWGIQDSVTPLWVGEKFHEFIKFSELIKVDHCGHAPMMERPDLFNIGLADFLDRCERNVFFETQKESYILD
jgi:2-hydroxy-6-oxonona-2,4-dienedioate hydrolase